MPQPQAVSSDAIVFRKESRAKLPAAGLGLIGRVPATARRHDRGSQRPAGLVVLCLGLASQTVLQTVDAQERVSPSYDWKETDEWGRYMYKESTGRSLPRPPQLPSSRTPEPKAAQSGAFSVPAWLITSPQKSTFKRPTEIVVRSEPLAQSFGSTLNLSPYACVPGACWSAAGPVYSGWRYGGRRGWGGYLGVGAGLPLAAGVSGWGGFGVSGWGGYGWGGWRTRGWGGYGFGVPGWGGYGWGGYGWGGGPGWGGYGWGGYGWGSGPGWGGYGWGSGPGWGGFGSLDSKMRLTNTRVIQTEPSKASGNYYQPATADPSASGGYYASGGGSLVIPASPAEPEKSYWGPDGNPFSGNK